MSAKPTRVLLVDDEDSLRVTLSANLEFDGYEVIEARSGEEALQLAQTHQFDIVLSDIRMPGINGVELFRRLRLQRPDLPCVLMTAFAMEDLIGAALEEGVFTLLAKPFDIQAALGVLARVASGPVVLVVDDARADAETTAALFDAVGLKARSVVSGHEALEVITRGDIDVCVVDMVMPNMTGAELITQLAQTCPSVPVIAMSGYNLAEMLRSAQTQVFTSFQKPVPPRELIRAVARARAPGRR